MDDSLIDDALRSDPAPPPHPFFRSRVMRFIRTPPLAFPWRVVAIAVVLGALAGWLVPPRVLSWCIPMLVGGMVFCVHSRPPLMRK
ncbi:MAG TPA: hypothetical protein VKB93_16100 [Thermoanaerobaculia bacterium]|nr:hypothetical protein [Thermoanaerobaculia bacterium]